MSIKDQHDRLKEMIIKAIDDHQITREEYDQIQHIAAEDGIIDNHEKALLEQLQDMIDNKTVKFVAE